MYRLGGAGPLEAAHWQQQLTLSTNINNTDNTVTTGHHILIVTEIGDRW